MYIKEKELNEIVKKEVIKRLSFIEVDKATRVFASYYEANDENMKKIKKYECEIQKLERKKKNLYDKKCEGYIAKEEFIIEYEKAKEEIIKYENLVSKCTQNGGNMQEEKIREIACKFKNGSFINNEFLKEIIEKIEVDSKGGLEIDFKV